MYFSFFQFPSVTCNVQNKKFILVRNRRQQNKTQLLFETFNLLQGSREKLIKTLKNDSFLEMIQNLEKMNSGHKNNYLRKHLFHKIKNKFLVVQFTNIFNRIVMNYHKKLAFSKIKTLNSESEIVESNPTSEKLEQQMFGQNEIISDDDIYSQECVDEKEVPVINDQQQLNHENEHVIIYNQEQKVMEESEKQITNENNNSAQEIDLKTNDLMKIQKLKGDNNFKLEIEIDRHKKIQNEELEIESEIEIEDQKTKENDALPQKEEKNNQEESFLGQDTEQDEKFIQLKPQNLLVRRGLKRSSTQFSNLFYHNSKQLKLL